MRPGDLWDIYHLLLHQGRAAADDLATASSLLRGVVVDVVRRQLIDDAARARSVLRLSNDDRYNAIRAEDLRLAADTFLRRLEHGG